MPYNKIDAKDRFYKLLTINKLDELKDIIKDEPMVEEYENKLIEYSKKTENEEENMIEAMDKFFMEQEAYEMGEEKGIEKNQHNIVLNMYKDKV